MRPLVNLASEPFRNRRLFWLSIILIFAVFSALGFKTILSISELDQQIAELEPKVKALEDRVKTTEKTGPQVSVITLEQNHELQAATELIARKAFSWSQLLNDLERYIPGTVRVRRISVDKIAPRQREAATEAGNKIVYLMFEVTGKGVTEVTKMIIDMEKSGIFVAEPVTQHGLEGTDEVEFTLRVEYHPRAAQQTPRAALANQVAEGGR